MFGAAAIVNLLIAIGFEDLLTIFRPSVPVAVTDAVVLVRVAKSPRAYVMC